MDDKLIEFMDKVGDYYKNKNNKLTTNEVIERILNKDEILDNTLNDNTKNMNAGLELSELLNNSIYNNENWLINPEKIITSHRKIIGKFIVFGKKIVRKFLRWYINPIVDEQNNFNGSVTRCINEIYNSLLVVEHSISEYKKAYQEIENKNKTLHNKLIELKNKLNDASGDFEDKAILFNNKTSELENKLNSIREYFKKEMDLYENKLSEFDEKFNSLYKRFESDYLYLSYRVKQIQSHFNYDILLKDRTIEEYKEINEINNNVQNNKIDYFAFENRFRGNENDIKENQKVYLQYFLNKNEVLDIGCGRGEFLELLLEHNILAKGIDIYNDFVDYCRNKGLNVENSDAIEYLRKVPDNSLGGIFLGQVIEHLEAEYLVKLIELCYKKLKNGAYFVAETPNPTMLTTFSNAFYVDISHIKPIHPETMKFLLYFFGYKDIKIEYINKINYQLPILKANGIENIKEFNDGINLINNLLFGYQDYAIIGKK